MGEYGNAMMRNPDAGVQYRAKAQDRTNAKLIAHPTGLPPNLLRLFDPRPPLEYKPPAEKRELPAYSGIAQFVSQFAEPGDTEYAPPVPKSETRYVLMISCEDNYNFLIGYAEKKAKVRELKLEQGATKVAEGLQKYDPQSDPNATGDPYKTLFVGRLSYETSERNLKKEFEAYGPIKRCIFPTFADQPDFDFVPSVDVYSISVLIWKLYTCKACLVTDKETKKSRGYAFIEYVHTRDMKNAYKHADGRKVDNRRVLVDVERGRTVPNWRPRRLGGGLGSSRISGEVADHKPPSREQKLAGRPRMEDSRRDGHHADRERQKSRERVRGRDQVERTHARSHERARDRESKEERHIHRNRDRTREHDQVTDRGRDCGHDRDRHGKDKPRYHGRDYDRVREHERSHDRGRDRGRDREGAGHKRNRGQLHDRDAEYGNVEIKRGRNMADYGQDGHGHETDCSKEHDYYQEDPYGKMSGNYRAPPKNLEPEAAEKGKESVECDYQFHQADN
ncbi:hypothetical protein EJB05_23774 [Eragrostis curvula]|uniref:RRM domain-containing protein n=1 Tax=Eragrostis curvula TaxID=38414 RepID=A0A5J9V7X7_9POAL|nr:hypothetical protein EJB05_23774 [Eragrostis curvula]